MVSQNNGAKAAPRVLVVEDSQDDRALYRRLLQDKFELVEAENVQQALSIAAVDGIACVVLDHDLPDGDGIGFIHELHNRRPDYSPAIVMVTGQGNEMTAAEAMKAGALDYMAKSSLTAGSIERCIRNAIDHAALRHENTEYQEELEKSCRGLAEFAHTASHDLKAPLRHIVSYCGILEEDFADKMDDEAEQYIRRLAVNAKRMQRLVDDLLAYSESRAITPDKELLDTNAAMCEALEFMEEAVEECGGTISLGSLPVVRVYPMRMKRLLTNLVSNALKYRREGVPPVVHIDCEEREKDFLFSISDNACGIAPEHRAQIFEPFKRLHSRDKIEGSGLGLSICREIVEMHGGRIWVESVAGEGSTFYFTIPKS